MEWISSLLFALALGAGVVLFARKVRTLRRNIQLGKPIDRSDRPGERWALMARVAMGQSKMGARPLAAFFHFLIYAGFVLINIEVLEIVIDGLFGTHRVFARPLGAFYPVVIGFFEILAVGVLAACVVFLIRRNGGRIERFRQPELQGWPNRDAHLILYIEIVLMSALLLMNAAEAHLVDATHAVGAPPYVVSRWLMPLFAGWETGVLHFVERGLWWFHILGILAFLNYLPYSKHFHIVLAFPNVWFSKLEPKGQLDSMPEVEAEVRKMLDPNANPYATDDSGAAPARFGAKDAPDLHRVQLLNAYACTECGRCSSVCPANQTGKKLSPRKIMMDVRDRIEEIGRLTDEGHATPTEAGTPLLDGRISREELWACTSCNACVEACPVNIDPLSIIVDMRRYLVMEESAAPQELNGMMGNIENNGAPWPFNQADRLQWAEQG